MVLTGVKIQPNKSANTDPDILRIHLIHIKSYHFGAILVKSISQFFLSLVLLFSSVSGQDPNPAVDEKLPDLPEVKQYQAVEARVQKIRGEVDKIYEKARTLTNEDAEELKKLQLALNESVAAMRKELPELRKAALAAIDKAPKSVSIGETLLQISAGECSNDQYAAAKEIVDVLMKNGNGVDGLYDVGTMVAFATDDFTKAKEYLQKSVDLKETRRLSNRFTIESMDQHIADWKKEQAVRDAEAAKGDLPRVKLATTEGDIVIELFENEAPQAVGNFVNLVEKKYYDGLTFHRVLPNFMAQGGCPDGRGTGGPGYKIYCECEKENYRRHFSGTLSMAHAGKNTGGSQFFMTFLPTPHLDGRHTAFGRVIEGKDVMSKIQRVDPQRPSGLKPTQIKAATVLRKRDHQYAPTKVE